MDEKQKSAGRSDARGAGRADRPYEDSFERAVDEFERANSRGSEFDDPEGWGRENSDYWTGAASRADSAERGLRLQSVSGRLGGLCSKLAKGRAASALDGDGWHSTKLTFGESAREGGAADRPQPSWRDAAWDIPASEEAKLGRISRRIAELWDRLLGVDRGMSRLEEAARKRRGQLAWPPLLDDGEDCSASIRRAAATSTFSKSPEPSAAPLGPLKPSPSNRPIVPVAPGFRRHPPPTELRLDGDRDRPADGVALRCDRVPPVIGKDELSAFFDLARDKAKGADGSLHSDRSRRGPRP